MKYLKLFENNTDWNKVLHSATWGKPKNSKNKYNLDFANIKLAIENGANVDSCGTMFWAVRNDNYEVVKFMLENGADVNYQSNDGKWTPLLSACSDGYVDIAKVLIDFGADPTISNFQELTVFDIFEIPILRFQSVTCNQASAEMKEKRDEIFKYLSQHKLDILNYQNPELAHEKFKDLGSEQKEKFDAYVASKKYNL